MNLRRKLIPILMAGLIPLTVTALPEATAAHAATTNNGTSCGAPHTADPNYTDQFTGTATMFINLNLAGVACKNIAYTATAYTMSGQQLASQTVTGDGTSSVVQFAVPVPGAPAQVCGLVSQAGNHSLPETPLNGCVIGGLLLLNGGSGASHWGP